jgi:hypothetical protein
MTMLILTDRELLFFEAQMGAEAIEETFEYD